MPYKWKRRRKFDKQAEDLDLSIRYVNFTFKTENSPTSEVYTILCMT